MRVYLIHNSYYLLRLELLRHGLHNSILAVKSPSLFHTRSCAFFHPLALSLTLVPQIKFVKHPFAMFLLEDYGYHAF